MNDGLTENADNAGALKEASADEADLKGFLLKIAIGGITVQDYVKRF